MEYRVMTYEQVALQAAYFWVLGTFLLAALGLVIKYRKTLYRWLFWPVAIVAGWAVPYLLGQWIVKGPYPW